MTKLCYAMELMLTIVIIFSFVVSVRGQVVCRASFNCAGGPGDDLGVAVDGAGCCLGNPNALAYNPQGSEDCFACVVVGFLNDSFSGVEQGPSYSVPVGYLKGGTVAGQNLVFDVTDTPGTAREGSQFDYTVNTLRVRALANGQISNVVLTFRVDSIAQEPNETFTLILDPVVPPNPRVGLFFRNVIEVTIMNHDYIQFSFIEESYRANEPDLSNPTTFLPVLVSKSARIASRVELVVVPLTVDKAIATSLPLPPNTPDNNPRSPPFANSADFNNTNITLVFEPDEDGEVNEKSAPIFITDDAINEATEQVFVAELILVSSIDPATVDLTIRPSTLCRIIDNDPIRIGFELPGYTYTEPQFDEFIDQFYVSPTGRPENGPVFFIKEDNVISEQTFLVSFQVTDSAPSGTLSATIDQDYRFGASGLTSATEFFLSFQQRIPFPFELLADTLPEGTEAFQASVSPEDTRDLGGGIMEQFPISLNPLTSSSEIFITILDNDPIIIGFTNISYIVDEDIGALQVEVRVLNPPDDQLLPASVDLVIQSVSGSATGGRDYQEIRANFFDVFLTLDDFFRQQLFPVTIINDSLLELDVEDFTLELRFDPFALEPPSNVILSPNISSVSITDDDTVVIGFLNTSYTVNENDGVANIQIGVIRGSLERSVVVQFSTSADSASDSSDYSGFAGIGFTVTRIVNASVPLIDDAIFELTEQFGANLAFPGAPPPRVTLAPDAAQVIIMDDDELIFGFDPIEYSVSESVGSLALGIFFISGNAGQFVSHVNASTVDGTAIGNGDFISVIDQSIFFINASRNQDFTVQILSDDFAELLNEFFTVVLSSVFLADTAGGAAIELTDQERARLIVNPDTATINILDDDVAIIGFQNTILNASEGSGGFYFNIAVLSGVLKVNLIINFTTNDSSRSAQAGLDYNATTVSLALNPWSTMKSVYVGIIDDDIFERSETFMGWLIAVDILPDSVHLEPTIAIATIYDHRVIPIGFSTNRISLNSSESNGTVALVVSVFNNMTISEGNTVRVRITTADNSAHALSDYIPISEVITFSSSATTQTVHVSLVNDPLLEIDEVFTASLSLEDETDRGHVQLNSSSAFITIVDDDVAVIGFVPPAYSVVEGVDRFASLTVQLISGQLGRDVIVNFDTQSGSAIDGLDYLAILNRPLMFGPSVRSQVVRIEILDDLILEKDVENFTATLSTHNVTPRLHFGVQLATVNITDNEIVRIGFQSAQYTVSEDSAIATIITIVVSGGLLEREIIVTFSTHDSTATAGEDYVGLSYRLTFDSSNTINVVPLTILDDQTDENMEIMSASLSFPGLAPKRVLLEPNATIVQIHDDDEADIGFISSHFTVRESDSEVNIQVGVLSGSLQKEVAIKFSVTELNAFAGEDYHEPQSLELTLDSTTSTQISIPIINDDIFELTESFLVNLSLIGGSTSQNSTRVLILDDDELVFGFSPSKYEIHEDDESAMVGIFIQGIPGDYQPVVFISTYNGTANEGEDFGAIASSEVTFTAGNRINNVTIPIIPNNSTESSEEFTVTLDKIILLHKGIVLNLSEEERSRLMLKHGIAVVKIIDDDVAVIGFLNTNLTIFEGGEVNFTIGVLQGYLDTIVTILFIAEASSAQAGLDYTSKLLNFTGDSAQIVSIQIIDDGNPEPSETFLGQLSSADGVVFPPNVLLQPNRATATIINENDLPTESTENNSIITVLVIGLVSALAFLTLMGVFVMVICFVVKKKKKEIKSLNPQEHVYESVLQPPGTLVTFSEPSKLDTDSLYDEVKSISCSTATQFELKASCSNSFEPPAAEDEAAPGTDPE